MSVFCLFFALFAGCSRESGEVSSLRFDFRQQKILSTGEKLSHIILNIRGPGIPQIISRNYDSEDSAESLPSVIEVEVPAGSGRLIQYMGVWENETDNSLRFTYADSLTDLAPGEQEVVLAAKSYNTTSGEGRLMGRYKSTDGSYPTGPVDWLFSPPNGRPLMLIERQMIYGGWFNFMIFDGVPFTYRLVKSSEVMFSGVDMSSPTLSPSDSKMHIDVPGSYEERDSSCRYNPSSKIIVGFFGQSGGEKVCYDDTNSYTYSRIFSDSNCSAPLIWTTTYPAPMGDVGATAGGVQASLEADLCATDLSQVVTSLRWMFDPSSIEDGVHDDMLWKGPFLRQTGGNYLSQTYVSSSVTLNWQFLPGATGTSGVSGVRIYRRLTGQGTSLDDLSRNRERPCDEVLEQEGGFSFVTAVPYSTTSASFPVNTQGQFDWAVCPFSDASGSRVFLNIIVFDYSNFDANNSVSISQ